MYPCTRTQCEMCLKQVVQQIKPFFFFKVKTRNTWHYQRLQTPRACEPISLDGQEWVAADFACASSEGNPDASSHEKKLEMFPSLQY